MKEFRFGVQLAEADSRQDWVDQVRSTEELGYSICVVPDHFGEQLGPVAALATAAEATSIRIGSFVLDNDFRHPLVLAKEAATLDLLSEGRFEFGLGAGWLGKDYDRSGIEFETAGTRLGRLEESVAIMKSFFAGDTFSFSGRHYHVNDVTPSPKRRPRLLIGGGGRRLLEFAAGEADIVSVFLKSLPDGSGFDVTEATSAATERKIDWMRAAAPDRFDQLEINVLLQHVEITDERERAAEERAADWGISTEALLGIPYELIGTVDEIVADLETRRQRFGISYLTVFDRYMREFAPVVERLSGS